MKRIRGIALLLALLMCFAVPAAWADTEQEEEPDPKAERLAIAQKEIATRRAGNYGMVPIYGRDVAD